MISNIEKGDINPIAAPGDYHKLLQVMASYILILTMVVVRRSAHIQEVVEIRKKLQTQIDLYVDIEPQNILYLLWEIFLDDRCFFSREVHPGEPLPES